MKSLLTTRCFLTGRGRAPGTPAFATPGLCCWPNVGDTPPVLTATDPDPGPCVLDSARALSSNSRLTPRETGTGVLVRGGCAGGCVGVGAATGVEGKGVPTEGGTTEPWAFASFLSSFYKRREEAYQLDRTEKIRNPARTRFFRSSRACVDSGTRA